MPARERHMCATAQLCSYPGVGLARLIEGRCQCHGEPASLGHRVEHRVDIEQQLGLVVLRGGYDPRDPGGCRGECRGRARAGSIGSQPATANVRGKDEIGSTGRGSRERHILAAPTPARHPDELAVLVGSLRGGTTRKVGPDLGCRRAWGPWSGWTSGLCGCLEVVVVGLRVQTVVVRFGLSELTQSSESSQRTRRGVASIRLKTVAHIDTYGRWDRPALHGAPSSEGRSQLGPGPGGSWRNPDSPFTMGTRLATPTVDLGRAQNSLSVSPCTNVNRAPASDSGGWSRGRAHRERCAISATRALAWLTASTYPPWS